MSNINGGGDDGGSFSSGNTGEVQQPQQELQNHFNGTNSGPTATTSNSNGSTSQQPPQPPVKKKRNLPGTPDPTAEVIALSPTTLMAKNRFVCEICNKGFQRDQNLQLHRRGHNLPWKLRQRPTTEIKKRVYICPEPSCVHHNPTRALGDLTGIKKHFSRKHGEKKWKCDKCLKKYAVQSDWKAHSKTCGTRKYKCDCGTMFSRRDSFITHRAFCDALTEENKKAANQGLMAANNNMGVNIQERVSDIMSTMPMPNMTNTSISMPEFDLKNPLRPLHHDHLMPTMGRGMFSSSSKTLFGGPPRTNSSSPSCLQLSSNTFDGLQDRQLIGSVNMSATALLQKAAQMGASVSTNVNTAPMMQMSGLRPLSYGGGGMQQQHNSSYDNLQAQADHQTQLVGMDHGGFPSNQFLQREMSLRYFDMAGGGETSTMTDVGMLSGLFMGGGSSQDQNGYLKHIDQDDNNGTTTNTATLQTRKPNSTLGIPINAQDMMTVDFLGVGGSRSANFHEYQRRQRKQQQQGLELEAISQQGLHGLQPFQQNLSYGQEVMEKPIWDA